MNRITFFIAMVLSLYGCDSCYDKMPVFKESELVGEWVLTDYAKSRILKEGYKSTNAKIVITSNKEVFVTDMPNYWLSGSKDSDKYDSAAGRFDVLFNRTHDDLNLDPMFTLLNDEPVDMVHAGFYICKCNNELIIVVNKLDINSIDFIKRK